MRPVTPAFLDAVSRSHQVTTRLEVLDAGAVTVTIDSFIDGTVTLDQTAATRGRLDCTIADPALVPVDPTDALAPYGNELRVYRGIVLPTGPELVSLGVFRIDEATCGDDGVIRVAGMDRSVRVIDARFEEPYIIAAGTNIVTAIETCVHTADPTIVVNLEPTAHTTPLLIGDEGGDRWKLLQDLVASIGRSLYFDGDGVLTGQPVTSPIGTPALRFVEGDGGVLLTASKRWTRQGAYNRVIATGENAGEGTTPARGVATDLNPLSPTYYYGPFGKVPRFYASQFLTTNDQCTDAAAAILARELGTTQTVTFGTIVNPALEPDDLVEIIREQAGLAENHVVDSITIPLAADGVMTGATRAMVVT